MPCNMELLEGKTLIINEEEKDILRSLQTKAGTLCRQRAFAVGGWTTAMEVSHSTRPSKAELKAMSFEPMALVGHQLPWDHTHECCNSHILQGPCHLVNLSPVSQL